jgi:hypothetical protein
MQLKPIEIVAMFNVDPQEKLTAEEIAEFERSVSEDHSRAIKSAARAAIALMINILCIIPFSKGHSLHHIWDSFGKYLVLTCMVLFLWFVIKAGFVWVSWYTAWETRREFRDRE